MVESFPGTSAPQKMLDERLESWKEIAAYLNRDVTTVQRWEKREGMPVHRHLHDKRGSVYALSSELDAWVLARKPVAEEQSIEPALEVQANSVPEVATHTGWFGRRGVLVGLLTGVILLLAGGFLSLRISMGKPTQPKVKSLAVLPLRNLSGDPAQEYLADGMTEELIGRLAGIRELRVVSRTSSMHFKDTQLSVPEICKELHVDAIVEGSVIREGSHIRVHAQLIRGASDEHFWSETYDREFKDLLSLQADVAQSVAQKVEVTLSGDERSRLTSVHAVRPDVYEDYLKGRFALDRGNTKTQFEESTRYFERAVQRDPTFAPAYVGLAGAYFGMSTVLIGEPPENLRASAMNAVRKALELDPRLLDAHVMLAEMLRVQWQWREAEVEYKRALELNPSGAAAHLGFAHWLLSQGRIDESLAEASHARELDPLAVSGDDIGWILFCAHRYPEAIQELRTVLAIRPEDASSVWDLGFALIANDQPAEAVPVLERALSVSDRSPGVMGVLVRAYAHVGRRADALGILGELKARHRAGYIPAAAFVNAYLGLDDREQAFVWLEQAYREHSNILLFLKVHPYFDPLRNDPRFSDLIRRVGPN